MENKHTPSPWFYEPYDAGDESVGLSDYPPYIGYDDKDGNEVEICHLVEPCYKDFSRKPQDEWDDRLSYIGNMEANARLITAAPDLLEALKSILGWRELRDTDSFPITRIEEIAHRAIEKAVNGNRD